MLREAGRDLSRLVRHSAPWRFDAVDATAPGLAPLIEGIRSGGVAVLQHDHFGNWHEAFPSGTNWDAYLGARDPALRTTIRRKLARAARITDFTLIDAPGAGIEAGIADYEAVRDRSWKPYEPNPGFDAVLMRMAAAQGALRLGVLRDAAAGTPMAAQYWIRSGERAYLLKLAHDEARRADSPGTVLTALMIRHLLTEGVRELDFGRGDDPYKRLWVGCRRQRIGLILASPLTLGGLAAVARHGAGRARRAVRARLGRGAA
nr:GNAT family N-acetyltransferase [Pararoseomonas baculiformis]